MMHEICKPIPGFEDIAEVSSLGRIRSIGRTVEYQQSPYINKFGTTVVHRVSSMYIPGKIRKPTTSFDGYKEIHLQSNDGRSKYCRVHRLVAEAFILNPENKSFVDHINGIKDDNRADNLRWVSAKENTEYAINRLGKWQKK